MNGGCLEPKCGLITGIFDWLRGYGQHLSKSDAAEYDYDDKTMHSGLPFIAKWSFYIRKWIVAVSLMAASDK